MKIEYRIATSADLPQLADLRWRLRVDDEPIKNRPAYDRFVADFVGICNTEWKTSDVVHWIAVDGANAVGVISIILVRKLPSPEKLRDRWGYISTSYVLPEFRNAGVGQELLAAVEEWAQKEDLELLVVWPSERAYPFYERSGFSRHPRSIGPQAEDELDARNQLPRLCDSPGLGPLQHHQHGPPPNDETQPFMEGDRACIVGESVEKRCLAAGQDGAAHLAYQPCRISSPAIIWTCANTTNLREGARLHPLSRHRDQDAVMTDADKASHAPGILAGLWATASDNPARIRRKRARVNWSGR